jgi:glycolate oxidase FAD binding subunit
MSDISPEQVVTPASVEEVAEIVRAAIADRNQISTRYISPSDGNSSSDVVKRVNLQKMNSVVEYPARDMTVTVEAGMPVSELGGILAEEKQQLPIDGFAPSISVGALVAGDATGPRQYGYGTLRDYVIGIEAVDGQGRIFHAGGRVVKNVAGYDLCRLVVGSRGSLGILTRITFKLKPLPACSMLRSFRFRDTAGLDKSLGRLNVTAANPVLLDFDFGAAAPMQQQTDGSGSGNEHFPQTLHIGVEGTEAACRWQLDELRKDCAEGEQFESDDSASAVEQHCRNAEYCWNDNVIRIRTIPSKLVTVASELAATGYSSQGHAGNGYVFVKKEAGDGRIRAICEEVVSRHSGSVSQWSVDHPADSTDVLSLRLRNTFDPHSVFCN